MFNYPQRRVVDLALHPRWIIPVVPRGQVLNKLSVIIDKGLIVDMLPKEVLFVLFDRTIGL